MDTKIRDSSMEQLSIDCIAQHLKVFHEQSIFDKTADFGEPCSTCPHAMKECRLEWLTRMKPLFDRTNTQVKLDYKELPQISVDKVGETLSRRIQESLQELNE